MDSATTYEELVARFKQGDERAFEELLEDLKPVIDRFVRKYTCGRNYDYAEDVRQVAQIGVMEAAWAFKPELGNRFVTYLPFRILGSIRDFMRRNSTIQIPRLLAEQARAAGHFTPKRLERLAFESESGQPGTAGQLLIDSKSPDPAVEALNTDDRDILLWSLSRLPQSVRTALVMRLQDATLKSIGEELGVCESRISQAMPDYLAALTTLVQARTGKFKPDTEPLTDGEHAYMQLVKKQFGRYEQAADLRRSPEFIYEHGKLLHGTIMLTKTEKQALWLSRHELRKAQAAKKIA